MQEVDDSQTERSKKYEKVVVTDVSETELSFYTQKVENGNCDMLSTPHFQRLPLSSRYHH